MRDRLNAMMFCSNLILSLSDSQEHPVSVPMYSLSRREQDKRIGLKDERNAGRLMQLLPKLILNPVDTIQRDLD